MFMVHGAKFKWGCVFTRLCGAYGQPNNRLQYMFISFIIHASVGVSPMGCQNLVQASE